MIEYRLEMRARIGQLVIVFYYNFLETKIIFTKNETTCVFVSNRTY